MNKSVGHFLDSQLLGEGPSLSKQAWLVEGRQLDVSLRAALLLQLPSVVDSDLEAMDEINHFLPQVPLVCGVSHSN